MDRLVEYAYRLSLVGKGALGLTQLIGALGLWLAPESALPALVDWLTRHELAQDPVDPIALGLQHWAASLTLGSDQFYAIYLLGHGTLNFSVVVALLLSLPGAFRVSLIVLGSFIAYQVYSYGMAPDPALLVLTAIDLVVIVLVVLERRIGARR
ncbi:DUF2127 domain-containing protein [Thetidibacter halocola]|uniref:DUF2127 domain-containing protein n=1 Tax=Thetidibacter halocola TaxID=2827239 RepID=A0A8J7WCA0_9RHOB|nr:DUF2127 domain-containing protein [Thetidibacter halocola]